MSEELHVYFKEGDCPDPEDGSNYVIRNNLGDEDDFWFNTLAGLELPHESLFSYDKFYTYLLRPSGGNLYVYLETYQKLESKIDNQGFERIVPHDLSEGYLTVLKDLCAGTDAELVRDSASSGGSIRRVIFTLSTLLMLFDFVLSLVFGRLLPSTAAEPEDAVLFIPFLGRTESMYPVVEEVDGAVRILTTRSWSSHLLRGDFVDLYRDPDRRSISAYANGRRILGMVRSLLGLQWSLLVGELELSTRLSEYLEENHRLTVPHTVEYACAKVLTENTDSVLKSAIVRAAVREIDPEEVVVGGLSPKDIESLRTADALDAGLHYIPHSITHEDEFVPPSVETKVYTTGPADNRLFKKHYEESDRPDLIPTGKPNVDDLLANLDGLETESKSHRIVIGTQAYNDWMREQFFLDSLDAIANCGYDQTVVVKIHPSEEIDFYRQLIAEAETSYEFDLVIQVEGLRELLSKADILLTINSNIGVEAIILDTYCISYNPFEPFTFRSSYIDGNHVPYTTAVPELTEELDRVIGADSIRSTQREHLDRSYVFGGSAERIAQRIR